MRDQQTIPSLEHLLHPVGPLSTDDLPLQFVSPFIKVQMLVGVRVGVGQGLLDVRDLVPLEVELPHHLVVALLEVIGDFKLALLVGDVCLHFTVGVVDDSQEHVLERGECMK